MKLFELSGIKKYASMSGTLIMKMLEKEGVFKKLLGKGVYGYAFELSDSEVLKIWVDDKAYEEYIAYCIKHQDNPYLLKVHGKIQHFQMRHALTGKPQDMKFIRVEHLKMPKSLIDFGYEDSSEIIEHRIFGRMSNYKFLKKQSVPEMLEFIGADVKKSTPKFIDFLENCVEVGRELFKHELSPDFHIGNFGMRGTQIVFIDPVVDAMSFKGPTKIDDVLKAY